MKHEEFAQIANESRWKASWRPEEEQMQREFLVQIRLIDAGCNYRVDTQ